jgi:predicted transcriptional regulator
MTISSESDFREFVKSEINRLGTTTYKLAEKIGIRGSNLQQILDGKNTPQLNTVLRIITALGGTIQIE